MTSQQIPVSRAQTALAILASACLLAIPAIVLTVGGLDSLALWGLAAAWVTALITALCAGTPQTS